MLGAIIGDIIGSVYEKQEIKTTEFDLFSKWSRFTDDTVLTIATADCILNSGDYTLYYQKFGKEYPKKGYGGTFQNWIFSENPQPYNSWGNGSAMRVSPIAYAYNTMEETLQNAKESAEVTHNHPEGIKGAQAIAAAIFLARSGSSKKEIKQFITNTFNYDLNRTVESIRPSYNFDVSCQGSVPESIIAFLDGDNYESTVRLAISLGGDADTLAAMAGSIAEAFYKEIPSELRLESIKRLPDEFIAIIDKFYLKYVRF